ncbi:MAG TPA: Uma2 family endonuclease [Gemmataceae bacterium]|nr:Uma2 family endonuclease [Gemmataceae bacterium]
MSAPVLGEVVAGRAPDVLSLTVDQYHRMIEQGILREGAPTELIDGILVRKDRSDQGGDPMSHGPRHALTIKRLERLLRPVESQGRHLHVQLPITLAPTEEPEPDLAVVRGDPEDFRNRHPGPADVVAVIEVSDSTLEYDRTTKQRLYAQAGIAVYWVINLRDGQVEIYDQPDAAAGRYRARADHTPGRAVTLAVGAAPLNVAVNDILPP